MDALDALEMAKRTDGKEDRSGRKTAPIQVEKDLARMAAVIASHDGITQADLVSAHLRPFLKSHYERVRREIEAELKRQNRRDQEEG